MISIFFDLIKQFLELFVDYFFIYGDSFGDYLDHRKVVRRWNKHFTLDWKK